MRAKLNTEARQGKGAQTLNCAGQQERHEFHELTQIPKVGFPFVQIRAIRVFQILDSFSANLILRPVAFLRFTRLVLQ
jgi:hypothetical protein